MSRRKSKMLIGCVQSALFTSNADAAPFSKSSIRPNCPRIPAIFASIVSAESRFRSADFPLGSPIIPVAPPASAIGRCPAC